MKKRITLAACLAAGTMWVAALAAAETATQEAKDAVPKAGTVATGFYPNDLGPAIRRALAVVKRGEPALVDVVTQPR